MPEHDHHELLHGRQGIVQHLQNQHREFYERDVMGVPMDSDRLFSLHEREHEKQSLPLPQLVPEVVNVGSVGPVARIVGYENSRLIFDQIVQQNVATRQIFTKHHVRPDGTSLTVVVELPETYSQFPPIEAGPDLAGVRIEDLLAEIRRRVEGENETEYDDQEASGG